MKYTTEQYQVQPRKLLTVDDLPLAGLDAPTQACTLLKEYNDKVTLVNNSIAKFQSKIAETESLIQSFMVDSHEKSRWMTETDDIAAMVEFKNEINLNDDEVEKLEDVKLHLMQQMQTLGTQFPTSDKLFAFCNDYVFEIIKAQASEVNRVARELQFQLDCLNELVMDARQEGMLFTEYGEFAIRKLPILCQAPQEQKVVLDSNIPHRIVKDYVL